MIDLNIAGTRMCGHHDNLGRVTEYPDKFGFSTLLLPKLGYLDILFDDSAKVLVIFTSLRISRYLKSDRADRIFFNTPTTHNQLFNL